MKKEIYTKQKVSYKCFLNRDPDVERCKECSFFNGMDETSVDCLYADIPTFNCHVTSFTSKGILYKSREYDEEKDGPLKDDDYCKICCFNKMLQNGKEVCLLRCGTDNNYNFLCYENEIWEKLDKNGLY